MDRDTFIATYVATFLASYNAGRYEEFCMMDRAADLGEPDRQPAEDAICMAEAAWEAFVKHRGDIGK